VWPMVEFEADDALAAAAFLAAKDKKVNRIFICTPDKDLSQCVQGTRIVQLDRRKRLNTRRTRRNRKVWGFRPPSIPDYLALVGDASRRLSRIARMGSEVSQGGSRALWPSRTNSDRLAGSGEVKPRESKNRSQRHSYRIGSLVFLFRDPGDVCGLIFLCLVRFSN